MLVPTMNRHMNGFTTRGREVHLTAVRSRPGCVEEGQERGLTIQSTPGWPSLWGRTASGPESAAEASANFSSSSQNLYGSLIHACSRHRVILSNKHGQEHEEGESFVNQSRGMVFLALQGPGGRIVTVPCACQRQCSGHCQVLVLEQDKSRSCLCLH